VAGIESRGFILGTACALELETGFVPIRKGTGVFPGPKAIAETSADYRGGRQTLRLQRAALTAGDRVLLVDDWLETGSQATGARTLIEECGATFLGVAAIVDELPAGRRQQLLHVHTLLRARLSKFATTLRSPLPGRRSASRTSTSGHGGASHGGD